MMVPAFPAGPGGGVRQSHPEGTLTSCHSARAAQALSHLRFPLILQVEKLSKEGKHGALSTTISSHATFKSAFEASENLECEGQFRQYLILCK